METEIGEEMRIRGVIANLDGAMTIKVTASRLPENFGFMLSHKSACCAPTQLEDYNEHKNPPGINGTLVEGRIVYDAYVFENKKRASITRRSLHSRISYYSGIDQGTH